MPAGLATAFSLTSQFPILSAIYNDGTIERSLIVDGVNPPRPARTWYMSRRLGYSDAVTFLDFFESVFGGLVPFYFYDPYGALPGTQIGSNYDPTGISTTGRVVVRFKGDWKIIVNLGRCDIPGITLEETT